MPPPLLFATAPGSDAALPDGRVLALLRPDIEVCVLGGWGGRPGTGGAWGADAAMPTLDLRLRVDNAR